MDDIVEMARALKVRFEALRADINADASINTELKAEELDFLIEIMGLAG